MHQPLEVPEQFAPSSLVAGVKDIIAHLDGTAEDEIRLAHAEALASLFEARLTGVYTNRLPDIGDYPSPVGAMAYVELERQLREDGRAAQARLAERFAKLGVANELRKIEAMPGDLRREVATQARSADLFVATCPPSAGASNWTSVIESVLFESGRSVFFAPEKIGPREAIRTVVIGWVDAREAARAVAEALPVLRAATATHLLSIEEADASGKRLPALAAIAAHLDRHGVTVNINMMSDAPRGAAAAILEEAHRVSADLIVTGAYGHSRLREWILGGATRDLIEQSDIPLLMAH
ncbi:MAG TPA: universal stress protein [Roseiarcus sp.]|nr:universal stress protein [Roseiarcus sp.]